MVLQLPRFLIRWPLAMATAAVAVSLGSAAQAGTVIISSGGIAIGTPGFYLSIGRPVIYPVPIIIHSPIYRFPHYPRYHLPRRRVYRYTRYSFPHLAIDDATPLQSDVGPNLSGSRLPQPEITPALLPSSRFRFLPQTLETDDLGLPSILPTANFATEGFNPTAESVTTTPTGRTYRLSAPNPFSESLRTLNQ